MRTDYETNKPLVFKLQVHKGAQEDRRIQVNVLPPAISFIARNGSAV